MKKRIVIAVISFVFLISIFVIKNSVQNGDSVQSGNANKIVGSELNNGSIKSGNTIMFFEKNKLKSLEELVQAADAVVIAEVTSDAETVVKENPKGMSDDIASTTTYSVAQIKIIDTLCGKVDSDTIKFTQIGEAGNDVGETKVVKGERYLFALHKHDWGYNSTAQEDGIFKVVKGNKVYSLSNNPVFSKYDNLNVEELKKDLQKSFKEKR